MINLIVAPESYSSEAEKITKNVVKYLKNEKVEYSVFFSQTEEDIEKNVKELISFGENEFVVVGDDLILNKVINSIKDLSKIKLGIISIGKNDDFAKYLGISSNPIQAIKNVVDGQTQQVDYLIVNNIKVLNNIIIGASVELSEIYEQYKLKNFITEKFVQMKHGNKIEGIELTLESKGAKPKKENVFELVIANGGLSKGKVVSPLSNVKDGLFNINYSVSSTEEEKKKFLKVFNKGEHIYDEKTKQLWVNNLKISNTEKMIKAIIDGKIETFENMEISLIEQGLKLYLKN